MINYEIEENSPLPLEDKYVSIAEKIRKENPSLPYFLKENNLHFLAYTVGELRIGDLLVTIKPRNPSLSLGTIFELAAYVNISSLFTDVKVPKYAYKSTFGISSLSDNFLNCVKLLLQFGLTGKIFEKRETSKTVKGRLVMENFNKVTIPQKGIETLSKQYSLNSPANQIIKSALEKILLVEKKDALRSNIHAVLRDFDSIDAYDEDLRSLDSIPNAHFSPNPYYPIAIQYAIIILKDLKLNYNKGGLNWHAFLENSNDLFEKYVLKILRSGLKEKVEKWEEPKKYATIRYNGSEGYKYFSPDILVDYDKSKARSRMVLDVKNKSFFPNKDPLSEIVEASDIYQLLFYCKRMHTNVGGLIYPTVSRIQPIRLMVEDETDVTLFLFSINMQDEFEARAVNLVEDVRKILSYS